MSSEHHPEHDSRKSTRRYGFACSSCNTSKLRCDGEKPSCRRCRKKGVPCIYKSPEAIVQKRLQPALSRIEFLEHQIRRLASADDAQRDRIIGECNVQLIEGAVPENTEDAELDNEAHDSCNEISVDERGQIQVYGTTSRFYMPADTSSHHSRATKRIECNEQQHRTWLASNRALQESLERVSYANVQAGGEIDPDVSDALLRIYWTWQHPLHNYVYRRVFIRDMALHGPYFSEFLLCVIYAHAARHLDNTTDPRFAEIGHGEKYLAKARLLLQGEMAQARPTIPTIQGLLLLGGGQCARGCNSEGWLYTGMAIRMMKDIGLHLNAQRLTNTQHLAPDDLEARKRLCLAAYTWDKSISICLGRPPSLPEMPYPADTLWDDCDNDEPWEPYTPEMSMAYPLTKSYNTLTFQNFCRLSQIINESYEVVYSGSKPHSAPALQSLEVKIRAFYVALPDVIKLDDPESLNVCPPPHVFALNMLYHVALILIYRPLLFSVQSRGSSAVLAQHARAICTQAATAVHALIQLYASTFKYKKQTYLVSYCVYTAATVNVHDFKSFDMTRSEDAVERLARTLQMLEVEATQTPGIKRSVDIIKEHLRTHFEPATTPKSIEVNVGLVASSPQLVSDTYGEGQPTDTLVTSDSQAAASLNTITNSLEAPIYQMRQQYLAPASVTSQRPISAPWLDGAQDLTWNTFGNVGGGFVPESLNWTAQDTFNMFNPSFA